MTSTTPSHRPYVRGAYARRPVAGAVLTAVLALTALGCGGTSDDAASASPAPSDTAADTSPAGDAGADPAAEAADGRDLSACADGDCEVAVSESAKISFPGPDGSRATLRFTEVAPNKVAYELTAGAGSAKGGSGGSGHGCVTVLRAEGSSTSCGPIGTARPGAQPDAVVIHASTTPTDTVLLHLVSS